MLRFAANLSMMYGEYAVPDRFAAAAKDGFEGVEFLFPYDYPAEDIAGWLRAQRLKLVLMNAPPGDWSIGERGLASLPGKEAQFRRSLEVAIEYARILDCPKVHVMAGVQAAGVERARMFRTFVANLAWAADIAVSAGKALLIEPINVRDMPGYLLNRQDDAHAIVSEVGSPALQVQMDLYHCQIVEGDVSRKLRKYLPQVGHIQIASVPERNEPDDGELDYEWIFNLLQEVKYEGWIGCEYRPKGGTSAGLGWMRRWR